MKVNTKLKIIRLVERLIGYKHFDNIPIKTEEYKIHTIKWRGLLYQWDYLNEVDRIVTNGIANELRDGGAIKIKSSKCDSANPNTEQAYDVEAEVYFIIKNE